MSWSCTTKYIATDAPIAATAQRSDAREELVEGERLYEIVVGAGVESFDAIADGRARGQHEDRDLIAGGPQAAADLDTVETGQTEIEDDGVVRVRHRELQAGGALPGEVSLVAGPAQRPLDGIPDSGLIFDQKDTHWCRVYERTR